MSKPKRFRLNRKACWYCKAEHAPENWCPQKLAAWQKVSKPRGDAVEKNPLEPGIDAARLEWLLRCEAAIKSVAAQFIHPKMTPKQFVDMCLKPQEKPS